MTIKYCVDCEHLEKRPCMVETYMDSGEYIHSGYFYYRCKKYGAVFNQSESQIEFQPCVMNEKG